MGKQWKQLMSNSLAMELILFSYVVCIGLLEIGKKQHSWLTIYKPSDQLNILDPLEIHFLGISFIWIYDDLKL